MAGFLSPPPLLMALLLRKYFFLAASQYVLYGKCLFSTQKIIVWKFQRVHQGGGGYDFVWSLYLNTSSARVIAKLLKEEKEERRRTEKIREGVKKTLMGIPSAQLGDKKRKMSTFIPLFSYFVRTCASFF